jgi:CBS domain-containing protein
VPHVSEVMTRGVRSMAPDESVLMAAQAMKELKVGVIPICENQTLVGLVTDRDIVVRAVAENCAVDSTPLSQVMTRDMRACREDDSVENVARVMRQAQVRRLPVVDGEQHLVGMVSLGDLATETNDVNAGEVLQELSEPSEPDRSRQSAASGAAGGGSSSGKRRRGAHRE